MTKVLIVYATDHGNTKKMAEVVASGVETVPDAKALVIPAEEVTQEDVLSSDAVIAGSPVHMSSLDWRVKKFIDNICGPLWMADRMIGKVGAVFACGGGLGNAGGGCEMTMLAMLTNFAEMGMILVPLPKTTPGYAHGGLQWGPVGRSAGENMEQTGVTDEKIEAAKHHGANVARAASQLKGNKIFGDIQPGELPQLSDNFFASQPNTATATKANKEIALRFYEPFNKNDVDLVDTVLAPDWVEYPPSAPGQVPGREGFKPILKAFRTTFPDLQITIEDTISEGDKVVVRSVLRGTHGGEFMGIAPTNKKVEFNATDIHRISNGKIVETWHIENYLALLGQIGVLPSLSAK